MALPRTVIALGVVSLLTDTSSDMIYPLLPAFLAVTLGAGPAAVGIVEGAAEATASLLKIVSGLVTDRFPRRKPLVVAGYGLSGLVRPLIGFAASWPAVLGFRVLDRVGKGVRTSPRDALIADVTPSDARGRAYGLHRAMDNAGAVLGPLAATALLSLGLATRQVFWCAAVPAVIVMLVLVTTVRELPRTARANSERVSATASSGELGRPFRRLLVVVVLFTLGNSSDAFLLLRLAALGLQPRSVTLAWTAFSLVRTIAVYVGGPIADRVDRRFLLAAGWGFYAIIYALMAVARSPAEVVGLLVVYGLYYGAVEPSERAIVADLAPAALRGTAFGWYHGMVGIAALPASALFGWLWSARNPGTAFGVGALLAALACVALLVWVPTPARVDEAPAR